MSSERHGASNFVYTEAAVEDRVACMRIRQGAVDGTAPALSTNAGAK